MKTNGEDQEGQMFKWINGRLDRQTHFLSSICCKLLNPSLAFCSYRMIPNMAATTTDIVGCHITARHLYFTVCQLINATVS